MCMLQPTRFFQNGKRPLMLSLGSHRIEIRAGQLQPPALPFPEPQPQARGNVFAALQSIPNPGISHSRRSPTQSRDPLSPPRLPPSSARHCLTVRLPIRRRRRSPHHHQSPFSPPSHLPELRLRRRRHYPFAVASPSPSSLLRPPWLHPSLQPSIPLSVSSAAPPLPLLPSPPRSMPPPLIDSIPAPLLLDLLFYQIYTAAPPSPLLLDIRRRSYLSSSTCSTPTLQLGSALESCSSTVTSTPCSQRDVHLTFAMEFKMLRNWRCSDLQSLQFSFILNFISASLSMVSFPIMLKTMSSCNRYILLGKEHDH